MPLPTGRRGCADRAAKTVQTSKHYRAKAAEMLRNAAAAATPPAMVAYWTRMASEWTALARRAEREDRFLRMYPHKP